MTAGEATREYYREQGRQQERQRMTETEAIRENYNLGVLAGEAREKQRIIKLLEDERFICVNDRDCWLSIDDVCDCKNLIALIKGEK